MTEKILMNLIVFGLLACIPLGIVLTFYFDNTSWLWLCLPLIIFLS